MLTQLFIKWGWSREDWKWPIAQLVAVAGLISSRVIDLAYWFNYAGIPITELWVNRIMMLAIIVLWIAGKYDTSSLYDKETMQSGKVPGSPSAEKGKVDVTKIVPLLLIVVLASACVDHAPPNLSPIGTAAWNATKVVKALDAARDFATGAEEQKVLSTASTRKVVLYHQSAVKTIREVPDGWKDVVKTGLDELVKQLSPQEQRSFAPYATLIKTLIEEVVR